MTVGGGKWASPGLAGPESLALSKIERGALPNSNMYQCGEMTCQIFIYVTFYMAYIFFENKYTHD